MARQRRGGTANPPRSLVGSARRVNLRGGASAIRADLGLRDRWQEEMWAYFDSSPEFKQAVIYTGSVAARVRPFPAAVPAGDFDGDPIPVGEPEAGISPDLAAAAQEELANLRSELGGQSEIYRLLNMNWEVAGECFLIGLGPRDEVIDPVTGKVKVDATVQSWAIHSISEVSVNSAGQTVVKIDGKGNGTRLDPDQGDCAIRMWLRHARWSGRADTAFRGCLTELRILQALSNERLALSQANQTRGPFRVPTGLTLAAPPPDSPESDATEDPLLNALSTAFTEPVEDPDSPYVLDYVYIRGDREDLKSDVFGPVDTGRKRDAELTKDVEEAVLRLARGANLPPEKVLGFASTTFQNARQIDRNEFDDYHDPRVRAMNDAFTIGYLRPNLLARESSEGVPAFDPAEVARVVVSFDPEDIIGMPPSEESATEGMGLGTISEAAWRHAKGFTEDDAPDALELVIRTALHATRIPPEIILAMLEPLAKEAGITLPTPAEALIPPTAPLVPPTGTSPPGTPQPTPSQAAFQDRLLLAAIQIQSTLRDRGISPADVLARPAHREPSDVGRRLAAVDRALFDRTHVAASAAMDRALERAGAKIRGKLTAANRALVTDVRSGLVAAHLGPAIVADAVGTDDDLFDGEFDTFATSYRGWVGTAQQKAAAIAAGFVDVDRERLDDTQSQNADSSRDWLVAALTAVAVSRLYRPEGDATPGEGSMSLTAPTTTIRSALARAGGSVTDAGQGPVGMVATGPDIMDALRSGGATVGGYTWEYGGSDRPFPPHEDLDGVEFQDYDDPALAMDPGQFPFFSFAFPSDHQGCVCSVTPTVDGPSTDLALPDGEG